MYSFTLTTDRQEDETEFGLTFGLGVNDMKTLTKDRGELAVGEILCVNGPCIKLYQGNDNQVLCAKNYNRFDRLYY